MATALSSMFASLFGRDGDKSKGGKNAATPTSVATAGSEATDGAGPGGVRTRRPDETQFRLGPQTPGGSLVAGDGAGDEGVSGSLLGGSPFDITGPDGTLVGGVGNKRNVGNTVDRTNPSQTEAGALLRRALRRRGRTGVVGL